MKTIGFVDYYISEWHANNYPAWIKSACKKLGVELSVSYVWAEQYISPVDQRNTDEWCAEFGAQKCETLEELCEKADYILVLSPSNPEKHLEYARTVLKYGKNTYIDKTFAPNYREAKEIFKLAKEYETSFFSSSALRYATELDAFAGTNAAIITGGGSSIEEYIIHQIEMLVKLTDATPLSVCVTKQGKRQYLCSVEFEGGKSGSLIYSEGLPFAFYAEDENGYSSYKTVDSDFFAALLTDIVRFFGDGLPSFNTEQTLYAIKIREGIINGTSSLGQKIYF